MRCSLFLFSLSLSALSAPAHAANERKLPPHYCAPAATIQNEVEYCEQNDKFIQKGDECLAQLEAEVKKESELMAKSFSPDTEQKQDEKFNASAIDYAASSASLAHLIGLTKLAISEVEKYPAALEEPEDADDEEVTGMTRDDYLKSVDCYADTRDSLEGLVDDFYAVLDNLEDAKEKTDAMGGTSATRKASVDALDDKKLPKTGKGKGEGGGKKAVPAGNGQSSKSDITGVEDDKAKQK